MLDFEDTYILRATRLSRSVTNDSKFTYAFPRQRQRQE